VKVSIIIPTYDRPNTLKRVVTSYINQKNIGELIIIDDASTKSYRETIAYVEELTQGKGINFKYKKNNKNMGSAFCRNLGISMASYDYILWGEDDAFLSDRYLDTLISRLRNNQVLFGSIFYGITPEMDTNIVEKLIIEQKNKDIPLFDYSNFEGYYRVSDSNIEVPFGHALILAPKAAYDNVEYYEKYWINGYREESDAQMQMVKEGYRIIYISEAECYHFPGNQVEKGGQHKRGRTLNELFIIYNTFIFFKRHIKFIQEKYHIKKNSITMTLTFAIKRFRKRSVVK
jgi:glycosyltransferase involved in cell wall biosynthesis